MAGRGSGPDFVESLARGLDILACFDQRRRVMTLAEVVVLPPTWPGPTARRLLITMEELGYVRSASGGYALTPQVLRLGSAYASSLGLWEMARPHLEALVSRTNESSSMSQLDGSDIVYVARVAVPKIIALRVEIGTKFPAAVTSQGKVLLAALDSGERAALLAEPSRSGLTIELPDREALEAELRTVRARGWALANEELARGVRSVAVPVRDGDGVVRAAVNVTVHAAETSLDRLTENHLPLLMQAASRISADWAAWWARPYADARLVRD